MAFLASCKPQSPSTKVNLEPVGQLDPCSSILDTQKRADCQSLMIALAESETAGMFRDVGAEHIDRFFGQPMTLTLGEKCLQKDGNKLGLGPCDDYEPGNKWHLVDVEVEYRWDQELLWGRVFYMVSRESVKRWAAHHAGQEASPTLECIKFSSISPNGPIIHSLDLGTCEDSKALFLTVPNGVTGDANLYGARWTRLLSIDAKNPRFAALIEALGTYNPYLTAQCQEGCLSTTPIQEDRIPLGRMKDAADTFFVTQVRTNDDGHPMKDRIGLHLNQTIKEPQRKNQGQQTVTTYKHDWYLGGCVHHRYNEERECFDNAAKGVPLSSFKKLYHALYDQSRGQVIQLKKDGQCILWDGSKVSCESTDGIDQPYGAKASQFRMVFVTGPDDKTEPFVQLQRVHPSGDSYQCFDIASGQEKPCCEESGQCQQSLNYMLSGQNLIDWHHQDQSYDLGFCVVASSTQENIAYDCVDYVDPKWKKYQSIADIIGFIPIIGSIPGYVLEGMVCKSGEVSLAPSACMSLTIGVAIDLAMLPLDLWGMVGTGAEVFEIFLRQGTKEVQSGLLFDFATDPVLASIATYAAGRAAKQINKKYAKEGAEAALKEMTEPLTRAIVKRALKRGISGAHLSSSFTQSQMERLIRASANFASGAI